MNCAVKALGRHGLGANIIPFDNVSTWYSNKDTRPSYDAFAKEACPLMTDIFKDFLHACLNIKVAVIHGEEPYKVIIKNGGAVPLELIVNKTHNVAHGCRLSKHLSNSQHMKKHFAIKIFLFVIKVESVRRTLKSSFPPSIS